MQNGWKNDVDEGSRSTSDAVADAAAWRLRLFAARVVAARVVAARVVASVAEFV
ncbi:MAG: hypothetical protein GY822_29635 [Deltaproteobacteria bacterium]|nr:hypothetical protein [Deltaproteobacteria bacterium]